MADSTAKAPARKPSRPYDGFPLFPHASKRWCKKIKGKFHYFGSWSDGWEKALQRYEAERDDLYAGRQPRQRSGSLTLRECANEFLTAKADLVGSGELSRRTLTDYRHSCKLMLDYFGKGRELVSLTPADFREFRASLANGRGLVSLGNEVGRLKVMFRWLLKAEVIEAPVRIGGQFEKPSKSKIRIKKNADRAEHGLNMFEPHELRAILDKAGLPLKAMILLALNGGFGQSDLSNMPRSVIDLESGWINYPRIKTGVERRCRMWPETRAAVEEWLRVCPTAKDATDANLTFVTRQGGKWTKTTAKGFPSDSIGREFAKIVKALELERKGRGFYSLRRSFATVGSGTADETAVRCVMGHSDPSMLGTYRQAIDDSRIERVCDHVHQWLFPPEDETDAA